MTIEDFGKVKIGSKVLVNGVVKVVDGIHRESGVFCCGVGCWYRYKDAERVIRVENTHKAKALPKGFNKPRKVNVHIVGGGELMFTSVQKACEFLGVSRSGIMKAIKDDRAMKLNIFCSLD